MKVWNWEGFWGYFTNLYLLEGALWTIGLTITTLVLGGMLGLLLAVMRLSKHKALSRASQAYVWIFRGTPLLVQLIIIYTGLPQLGLVRFNVLESAIIGLALNEAAYLSEILRGGILSVAKGQREAGSDPEGAEGDAVGAGRHPDRDAVPDDRGVARVARIVHATNLGPGVPAGRGGPVSPRAGRCAAAPAAPARSRRRAGPALGARRRPPSRSR